ncbi:MAG: hypothetical protein WC947_02650 [Elusimicrobiota bacterium]
MEKLKNKYYKINLEMLKEEINRDKIAPDLGKFAIQQNEVQDKLCFLIKTRGMRNNLIDKKWCESIENVPLGVLIASYQLCANKVDKEKKLLDYLKKYKIKRNDLIHKKLDFNNSKKDIKIIIKDEIALGCKVLKLLDDLLFDEIKYKLLQKTEINL